MLQKIFKKILLSLLVLVLIIGAYVAYVFISYHRIDDNIETEITSTGNPAPEVTTGTKYRVASANLGFGAYSDDYSFFMDGGTESWAFSKEAVKTNIVGSAKTIMSLNPDIIMMQEVDIDSTRSYHVNEEKLIKSELAKLGKQNISSSFAMNYDSPFLMYPPTQPHGKSKSGLLTISDFEFQNAIRRSLPIETGISKLIDLDRCYNKIEVNVDNGKKLILYNVHLSAYTTDPQTSNNQVKVLNEDMTAEAKAGNYVILGGDMNKDLLLDSTKYFGVKSADDESWAKPFPVDYLDGSLSLVAPLDEDNPIPSCRNADAAYTKDTFVVTVDGFIVSNNVDVIESHVMDAKFKNSDHNPVYMDFILK